MELSLILVPYHLGQKRVGMGLGPERLLRAGVSRVLGSQGHDVSVETIQCQSSTDRGEIFAISEINALLAKYVGRALEIGRFPLILAGNCNTSLGALAGIEARPVGVIWLDAHGDFNTPETSITGFLDGMSLAIAAGLCHRMFWARIGGTPVRGSHVVHIGGRDFDAGEEERLISHQIHTVSAGQVKRIGPTIALRPALAALRSRVGNVYLHVDLDVLDSAEACANEFAAPDGPSLRDLECMIRMVGETLDIKVAALTAYDPAHDEGGRALRAGIRVIRTIVDTVAQTGRA